ncbi:hypothetical protein YN1_7410 [Nanoarchaeota archaeon]
MKNNPIEKYVVNTNVNTGPIKIIINNDDNIISRIFIIILSLSKTMESIKYITQGNIA